MTNDNEQIFARIQQTIARSGMSGTAFAKRAAISSAALREYVAGRSLPGALALRGICVAARVSADWLLFGDEVSPTVRRVEINEVR